MTDELTEKLKLIRKRSTSTSTIFEAAQAVPKTKDEYVMAQFKAREAQKEREVEEWKAQQQAIYQLKKKLTESSVLAPIKHKQRDFFVADLCDVAVKDDMASMEHPLFALQAGDKRVREYQRGNTSVTVKPGHDGCATIHDKDIWIYCISQMVEAQNRGREIDRVVHFTAYDFLVATNRPTNGGADGGYKRMAEALERLAGTRIETNIETAEIRERQGFGLVDSWRVVEEKNGRMVAVEVTLPNWLFRSVESRAVLTLSQDYFRIRKAFHRRVYELARKHCGAQFKWQCTIDTLHEKSGSRATKKEFHRLLKELVAAKDLPDYKLSIDGEMVRFNRKK